MISRATPPWPAVDKAELADNTPRLDPEAGAEILCHEGVLDHASLSGSEDRYYTRAKIYNQRGVEHFSLFRIPYDNNTYMSSIAARTIKPDGTIIELTPKDFHEQELVKAGDIRIKTESFAFPGLEPGAIVEFRYTLISTETNWFVRLIFQGPLPTRVVNYKLSLPPEVAARYDLRAISYNCPGMQLKPDHHGFYHFEMANLPAVKEEPFQPSDLVTHASMLVYFTMAKDIPPDEFWRDYSKELNKKLEKGAKVTKSISTALSGIISPTDSDEVKLHKIYDYCRTAIINRNRNTTHFTREQRKDLKPNETASDTLKSGNGTGYDINLLFAALVRSAGLEVRLAACNDRQIVPFNPKITEPFVMVPHIAIAVKAGDSWRYFDPGETYLPFGVLMARNTDTAIIMSDPKGGAQPSVLTGPPAEANLTERKATFHLDADGTLSGDVTESYAGQPEVGLKFTLDNRTPEKCATYIRRRILSREKLARVSSIVVENNSNPLAPAKISYHLNIPGYADRTGTRLFFQPAVFEKGTTALFEASERRTAIIFPYRSLFQEDIHFLPPAGYSPEEATAPSSFTVENLLEYRTSISLNKKTGEIIYRRAICRTGIAFPREAYPQIKTVFDRIHEEDGHTLALKRTSASNAPEGPAVTEKPAVQTKSDETKGAAEDDDKEN